MKMTIGKKLTFGFGGVMVLMLAAIAFCIGTYLKAANYYEDFTEKRVHQMDRVADLELHFKKQTQAFKNLLLRGHDPKKLEQYQVEFREEKARVESMITELISGSYRLLNKENLQSLDQFEKEYAAMNQKYDEAIAAFSAAGGTNQKEVDAGLVGIDRSLTALLENIGNKALEVTGEMLSEQSVRTHAMGSFAAVVALAIFVVGIIVTAMIIRSITTPLKSLMDVSKKIGNADLSHEINIRANDEIGELAGCFKVMIAGLRSTLLKLQEATGQITSASTEILAASQEQASAAREQSSAVAETTSAAKELSSTSEMVGESIKKVAQVAAHALAGMAKIKESIDKTNGMLNSLGEKSQKIGKITEMIDDVADQTNLLAVNASIEAARAGEQGRGFTVVADEIRKLADSTAKSTKDITALIELIQHEMSNAILSMEKSIQSVDEEARLAQQTTEKSKEIAMSANQQVSGAKQIAEAMMNIDETMKQVAAGAQQSQVSVKQLTALAAELNQLASKFKL